MIAIYARQSVDRADSISIESQIELCRAEARGGTVREYADRGYSGKNTERPAFQALLRDVEAGRITAVIVYKLDRISRSILDFTNLMELFGRHGVDFLSHTERFDTSTPMGRAMLHICVVFAQLERETIQRRVADAYRSRSLKSLYMGGRVPYGFRLEPAEIAGIKSARYCPHPEEAAHIRRMYELYAEPGASYGDVLDAFRKEGVDNRGKPWDRSRLAEHLKNPVYVRADLSVYEFLQAQGAVLADDPAAFTGARGLYSYREEDAARGGLSGLRLVLAPHEGLVSAPLWLACRKKCLRNKTIQTGRKAIRTWLAGLVKCGACGYALTCKSYREGGRRYLVCSRRSGAGDCPGAGTLHADALEKLVEEALREKCRTFPVLRPSCDDGEPETLRLLRVELLQTEREIESLLQKAEQADGPLFSYLEEKLRALDRKKRALLYERQEQRRRMDEAAEALCLRDYFDFWERLSPEDKRETAASLIERIEAERGRVRILWRI
ncbi:MAG: recombinase family protein [Clostridiales bacterium]|nr:MAG: recombinase family protein [Clostridiales bacterium]